MAHPKGAAAPSFSVSPSDMGQLDDDGRPLPRSTPGPRIPAGLEPVGRYVCGRCCDERKSGGDTTVANAYVTPDSGALWVRVVEPVKGASGGNEHQRWPDGSLVLVGTTVSGDGDGLRGLNAWCRKHGRLAIPTPPADREPGWVLRIR